MCTLKLIPVLATFDSNFCIKLLDETNAFDHVILDTLSIYYIVDRAFISAAPNLWNSLPNDIRSAKTVDHFKKLVKTHLFKIAFY
jgi:hypothetical protein